MSPEFVFFAIICVIFPFLCLPPTRISENKRLIDLRNVAEDEFLPITISTMGEVGKQDGGLVLIVRLPSLTIKQKIYFFIVRFSSR